MAKKKTVEVSGPGSRASLHKNTTVHLGVAITVMIGLVALTWHVFSFRADMRTEQTNLRADHRNEMFELSAAQKAALVTIEHQLERLTDKIESRMAGRLSRDDMEHWVEILEAKNPTLVIPDDFFR